MAIKFSKTGVCTTFQDQGRFGNARFGINHSGVMDWFSAKALNILLENNPNEAVLELFFPAAEIEFLEATQFAIIGGNFEPTLNYKTIENNRIQTAAAGDILRFKQQKKGTITYFSVAGGFALDTWLGSVSPNQAADFQTFEIQKNTVLAFKKPFLETKNSLTVSSFLWPKFTNQIRFIPSEIASAGLEKQDFKLNQDSNRMGYRFDSITIEQPIGDFSVSEAVNFGTIQLLPSGQIIILMADHQTSGGYPRLGQVILADLPLLAQLQTHQSMNLIPCSIEVAEDAYFEQLTDLRKLAAGVAISSK